MAHGHDLDQLLSSHEDLVGHSVQLNRKDEQLPLFCVFQNKNQIRNIVPWHVMWHATSKSIGSYPTSAKVCAASVFCLYFCYVATPRTWVKNTPCFDMIFEEGCLATHVVTLSPKFSPTYAAFPGCLQHRTHSNEIQCSTTSTLLLCSCNSLQLVWSMPLSMAELTSGAARQNNSQY